MKWVNLTRCFLDMPVRAFWISFRDLEAIERCSELGKDPGEIEKVAGRLMRRYRPQYAEAAILVGIDVNIRERRLELAFVHHQFDRIPVTMQTPFEPLISKELSGVVVVDLDEPKMISGS